MTDQPQPSGGGPPGGAAGPFRAFRPRAVRVVGWVLAVAMVAMVVTVALLLPQVAPSRQGVADRIGIVAFGVLVAGVLLRHAGVRAVPDAEGLTVTNLVLTRRVVWAQIVSVRFGQGRPWVQLDLDDGQTLAVMAVQRADGARALREARRMATLVARYSVTPRDD